MSNTDKPCPNIRSIKSNHGGTCNPYALAGLILGKKIDWESIENEKELLEKTFNMSYEKLFDPKSNSPIFNGADFLEDSGDTGVGKITWKYVGDFFRGAAEITDVFQGAAYDCFVIAALASVAWTRPYLISKRTRATDDVGGFVDMFEFYDLANNVWKKVEVTELLPVAMDGDIEYVPYASSSTTGDLGGETWPGVYEKALLKWINGDNSDTPDYGHINNNKGGDTLAVMSSLTGLLPVKFTTQNMEPGDIAEVMFENCNQTGKKTFNPMTAWTYDCGDHAPEKISYKGTGLIAWHAYSILGYDVGNDDEVYIVLRNVWGRCEGTLDVKDGYWTVFDSPDNSSTGFWRTFNLPESGIFALRVDTFKKYFAGFGVVRQFGIFG